MHDEAEAARNSLPERAHQADDWALHEGLSARDIEALLANEAVPAHVRSLAGLFCEGNVKLDDALALTVGDVTPTRREIPVSEQTRRVLREAVGDREQGPLFAKPSTQRVSRGRVPLGTAPTTCGSASTLTATTVRAEALTEHMKAAPASQMNWGAGAAFVLLTPHQELLRTCVIRASRASLVRQDIARNTHNAHNAHQAKPQVSGPFSAGSRAATHST